MLPVKIRKRNVSGITMSWQVPAPVTQALIGGWQLADRKIGPEIVDDPHGRAGHRCRSRVVRPMVRSATCIPYARRVNAVSIARGFSKGRSRLDV